MTIRIGFMGTPDFSVPPLRILHQQSAYEIVCVYSQPPRPKGRGQKTHPSPVHRYAQEAQIPVFTPTNFKHPDEQKAFADHHLDIAIVVAYGLLLPPEILEAPKYGCINIHASLLPRWRGASPIQQAIWAGDEQTGISIMQMDKGLDTGPVIEQSAIPITETTTTIALHDQLSELGADMILKMIEQLAKQKEIPSQKQDSALTTYAPLLKKSDGQVKWAHKAASIDCQIRALNPWPGVWSDINTARIKIRESAGTKQTSDAKPGTILDRKGHVACGENTVIQLTKIQPPNVKSMDFSSAINGGYVKIGEQFS